MRRQMTTEAPKVGDLYVLYPPFTYGPKILGPLKVERVGKTFMTIEATTPKFDLCGNERGGFRGCRSRVERYDPAKHDKMLEASTLGLWWQDVKRADPTIDKLRAMKAAYESVTS